ncbi:stress response membrane protein YncL [Enterobacter hormaechei]|nr:stress response membrane protein YncL [Enterobacter hormaechei]
MDVSSRFVVWLNLACVTALFVLLNVRFGWM